VDIEDAAQVVLTNVTLKCAGDCIDVQAFARGGIPPYTYRWSDGRLSPTRANSSRKRVRRSSRASWPEATDRLLVMG
jgi:hypothetical protein